ncbi:hypothetical protein SHIRM173S_09402 [Streptomyces hirsutus]
MDLAIAAGAPASSALNDGAGAALQEGVTALAGYGGIFQRNTTRVRRHPADQRRARPVRRAARPTAPP